MFTDPRSWKKVGTEKQTEVVELQKWLNANGYNAGAEDGVYGKGTANAVRAFQQKAGLGVDGDAGPNTLKAMQSAGGGPARLTWHKDKMHNKRDRSRCYCRMQKGQTGVDGPADATALAGASDATTPATTTTVINKQVQQHKVEVMRSSKPQLKLLQHPLKTERIQKQLMLTKHKLRKWCRI